MSYSTDVLNTITSMNATVTTPAGTFENLVEVTDADGFIRYFTKGYGHIGSYKKTTKGMEPEIVLNAVE